MDITIEYEARYDHYIAVVDEHRWAVGGSRDEALGALIRTFPEILGHTVIQL